MQLGHRQWWHLVGTDVLSLGHHLLLALLLKRLILLLLLEAFLFLLLVQVAHIVLFSDICINIAIIL